MAASRVTGYKWLCVEPTFEDARGVTLRSAFDAHLWTRGTNRASYKPSHDNLWGFNAYYSATRARWHGRGMVIVGVIGFGDVALFERGWRAEKAEIVSAYLSRRCLHRLGLTHDARALFIARLSATYDVPVYRSLRRLRRETQRWGQPGGSFMRSREEHLA